MLSRCVIPILVLVTACSRLSPNEEKVVGTWEYTGIDATGRVVLRRDHTVVDMFFIEGAWEPVASGTWRLEGNELVTEENSLIGPSIPGDTPRPKEITRLKIRAFERNKLVRDEDSDFTRVILQ
jgi:hypothetical protein